jgi:hypothetical protein
MKTVLSASVFLLILGGLQVTPCHAQGRGRVEKPGRLLRALRQNAMDAADNASIYQWKRVNREVDRITADAHKLSTLSSPSVTQQSQDLQQAVRDLRSARLRHRVEQIVEAAHRLVSLSDVLLASNKPGS